MSGSGRVLIVEDEEIVAALLRITLEERNYLVTCVDTAEAARQQLRDEANCFDLVLLDRRLPGMDGLALLKEIKASASLAHIPVVMETAVDDTESVREGLAAGAQYYLTKPIEPRLLLAVVEAALAQQRQLATLRTGIDEAGFALRSLGSGSFRCRTLAEARSLAHGLALAFPDPDRAIPGLLELLVNAVEHGNLGLRYAEKTALLIDARWEEEVARRSADPVLGARAVTVELKRTTDLLTVTIRDEGAGFDWRDFLELSPQRAFDPHGRGIAMARLISFDTLDYQGNGNTVVVSQRFVEGQ